MVQPIHLRSTIHPTTVHAPVKATVATTDMWTGARVADFVVRPHHGITAYGTGVIAHGFDSATQAEEAALELSADGAPAAAVVAARGTFEVIALEAARYDWNTDPKDIPALPREPFHWNGSGVLSGNDGAAASVVDDGYAYRIVPESEIWKD